MFLHQAVQHLLLDLHLMRRSLEQNRAQNHFVGIKPHYLSNKVLFGSIHHLVPFVFILRLQRHAEHELLVVHQTDTSGPNTSLRH